MRCMQGNGSMLSVPKWRGCSKSGYWHRMKTTKWSKWLQGKDEMSEIKSIVGMAETKAG